MLGSKDRRTRGSGVGIVLLFFFVVGAALSLNYVRNYQIDKQDPKNGRPYERYERADLALLAEGYRLELAAVEKRQGAGRVQVRQRHHLSDQVREFERVQKQARRARDKALDIVQLRKDVEAVEAEQQCRGSFAGAISAHVTRMFRF